MEAQVEEAIAQSGAEIDQGLARRLSRAFVQHLEETGIENLEVKPSSHYSMVFNHITVFWLK